jgi:hypothetical protein
MRPLAFLIAQVIGHLGIQRRLHLIEVCQQRPYLLLWRSDVTGRT